MRELALGNRGFRRRVPNPRRAAWVVGLMLCAACVPALAASGKCKLGKMVEFQVTMDQMAPVIAAKINGTDVRLMIDSGMFYSSLDPGSASSLGLRLHPAPIGFYVTGIGGRAAVSLAKVDARLPLAFVGRCRARALGDLDLQRARKDCDTALKRATKDSAFYAEVSATRGLLLLRLGDYDKSIADDDASLKINPKNAFALYGQGIDKRRKQRAPDGQADIAQAIALAPKAADDFNRYGIAP